jgi:hypothetical protein
MLTYVHLHELHEHYIKCRPVLEYNDIVWHLMVQYRTDTIGRRILDADDQLWKYKVKTHGTKGR